MTQSLDKLLRMGEGRRLKRLRDAASYIATLESDFERLSDAELQGKTAELHERWTNGEPLEKLLFPGHDASIREQHEITGLRRRRLDAVGHVGEAEVVEVRDDEAKCVGSLGPQAGRDRVRTVAELGCGLDDPVPGLGPDDVDPFVPQHPRDGGWVDAG